MRRPHVLGFRCVSSGEIRAEDKRAQPCIRVEPFLVVNAWAACGLNALSQRGPGQKSPASKWAKPGFLAGGVEGYLAVRISIRQGRCGLMHHLDQVIPAHKQHGDADQNRNDKRGHNLLLCLSK